MLDAATGAPVRAFHHITLNTGHVALQARSTVSDVAVRSLFPAIRAEGGPVPAMPGWFLDFWFPLDQASKRRPGGAVFQIAPEPDASTLPAVMGVACWRDELSAEAWKQAADSYRTVALLPELRGVWRKPPPSPPRAPWLAVWLTPLAPLITPR